MPRLTVMQLLPALDAGGVERGTFEVAEALVRAGHRSLVVSGGGMLVAPLEATGSRHFQLNVGRKSPAVFRTVGPLRDLIERHKVDVLHARSRLPAWVAWRALKRLNPRPRFVTTLHGLNSVSRYSSIMTRGDRVIAVSQTARSYWLKNYPSLTPDQVSLIYRGVDTQVFRYGYQPEEERSSRVLLQAGIPSDQPLLMMPGRITATKGFGAFVNLLARLKVKGVACHGVIIGDYEAGSGYQARLNDRIERLDVRDRITFTGPRQDLRDVLCLADLVFCLSTKRESFGRVAAEALALGKPVLGFDHGGIGEVLDEIFPQGRVPATDEVALLEKTLEFLNSPPEVPDRQPFLKSQMQEQTLELYETLTKG
ncbi:MAG: glycosyltransferase family 4 protein [Pseudomonadota bacterium]